MMVRKYIQREDETYGEFYSRIQNYIEGIKSLMAGKEVEFGERGVIVQENNVVQQYDGIESETTIQGNEESQLGQGINSSEMPQQENSVLSFQDIGRETVESFKRNPQEAIKMMQKLERGIAELYIIPFCGPNLAVNVTTLPHKKLRL